MAMLIRDILLRDSAKEGLVNKGQARIANELTNDRILAELRGELSTFVCEGQYAEGTVQILSSYLANRNQTSQRAAWVSGFFGSGKSHLLKMLCHLWADTVFPDGATARSLVPELPDEARDLLRELDIAGKRSGGLLAAAGTLPAGTTESVRLSVLSILLRACDLPVQYPQAQFHLWLEERGILEKVKGQVEAAGKVWFQELNNLYVSPPIANSLLAADPDLATGPAAAHELLRAQFPLRTGDLTTEEFLSTVKRVLRRSGKGAQLPCTLIVLDETQQYIGDSEARSSLITEIAEAVCKELDSQVMLVAAGQSSLNSVKLLNKLLDRFTIRIQLSDTDVETVTRKVLLRKQPSARKGLAALLDTHAGEISRQLQGTALGERVEDKNILLEDYPLLPVRRRFWEACFRQVDTAGTQSQLRSQLRILHDCLAGLSGAPVGRLIPGDDLYKALAPEMVTTGALPREINERILALGKDGTRDAQLRQRICGLVFLMGQLPRAAGADTGVRSTKEHIADLMVDDLAADNGKLRSEVGGLLERLADEGVLMRIGDEFRIQTEEGRTWEEEFRRREAKLKNDAAFFDEQRDRLLGDAVARVVAKIRILHGSAKVSRSIIISRAADPPTPDGESIPLWLKDGFSTSEKDVLSAARAAGVRSPVLFVFIPRKSRDELLNAVAAEQAAEQALGIKGNPSTDAGQLARQSMQSRKSLAEAQRQSLVDEIANGAKVFQGGGNELLQLALEEKLRAGAEDSLARLFPRFADADAAGSAWESALKRARDGADQPFSPVGHQGPIEQHVACKQLLTVIGAGKVGAEIRKELERAPFGWPRDAVDAALIALHRSQHVTVTLNGVGVAPGQLDQNKISKSEFRVEKTSLSVQDRTALRALYQEAGVKAKGEELDVKAPEFFAALKRIAQEAGGDPPLPTRPGLTDVEDVEKHVGNERLAKLRAMADDLKARLADWKSRAEKIAKRLPPWGTLDSLAAHAAGMAQAQPWIGQRDAILSGRLLVEDPDPVAPVLKSLADLLRQALNAAHAEHEAAYRQAMGTLVADPAWARIAAEDQERIAAGVGLTEPSKPDVSTEASLLAALDDKDLAARHTEAEAIPARVEKARQQAAKLLEPDIQFVTLDPGLLRTEVDVDAWLAGQKKKLMAALEKGPVQVK